MTQTENIYWREINKYGERNGKGDKKMIQLNSLLDK